MIPDNTANDPVLNSESSTAHDPAERVPIPSELLHTMRIPALAEHCLKELDKYKHGEPSNGQYGLELFYRALKQRDALAWEAVQQCFDTTMHCWMSSHPLKEAACRIDSEENYIAQAFSRFWQATVNNQEIAFQALGAALRYLRVSLHAVIVDTFRAYTRARVVSLPEAGEVGEPLCEDHYDSGELWQVITHLLPDERERRVAYLLYHCGLKPREIVHFCSQEFDDVREIYHIRRSIIDRLRRNADYLHWRLSDEIVGD